MGSYSASKFGIIGFKQSSARELGSHNIRVNAVCSGFVVSTEQGHGAIEGRMKETGKSEEEVLGDYRRHITFDRFPEVSEVSHVATFLDSGKASYVTGQTLNVCGGIVFD